MAKRSMNPLKSEPFISNYYSRTIRTREKMCFRGSKTIPDMSCFRSSKSQQAMSYKWNAWITKSLRHTYIWLANIYLFYFLRITNATNGMYQRGFRCVNFHNFCHDIPNCFICSFRMKYLWVRQCVAFLISVGIPIYN